MKRVIKHLPRPFWNVWFATRDILTGRMSIRDLMRGRTTTEQGERFVPRAMRHGEFEEIEARIQAQTREIAHKLTKD